MRFTLLTDGASDTVLLHVLGWLLGQRTSMPFIPQWADLRYLPRPPKQLGERVETALELYPCELLFIHRDAESVPYQQRMAEIRAAIRELSMPPVVCVVPVRMQEAWLLFDEKALRQAAGCPSGREPLYLPPLSKVEALSDPKQTLYAALRTASGLGGRRLKQFRPQGYAHRLAELIDDFTPLRQLSAFRALEEELIKALEQLGCPPLV